jgi:hypothetical protein
VSDSSARVKETKEASYDTDEGGFLLVFSLAILEAVLLFCLCCTTPRQEIPNTQLKRGGRGEVLASLSTKLYVEFSVTDRKLKLFCSAFRRIAR